MRSQACTGPGWRSPPRRRPSIEAAPEVMVDFTVAAAARDNLRWCADHGVHAVCGTTGFEETDLADLQTWFSGSANAIVAANFSIGAALMMRLRRDLRPLGRGRGSCRAPSRPQAGRSLRDLAPNRQPHAGRT